MVKVLLLILPLFCFPPQMRNGSVDADVVKKLKPVIEALNNSDAAALCDMFAPSVEVATRRAQGVYSSKQAQMILAEALAKTDTCRYTVTSSMRQGQRQNSVLTAGNKHVTLHWQFQNTQDKPTILKLTVE